MYGLADGWSSPAAALSGCTQLIGLIIPSSVQVLLYVRVGGPLKQLGGCPERLHSADGSNNTHVYPGAAVWDGWRLDEWV